MKIYLSFKFFSRFCLSGLFFVTLFFEIAQATSIEQMFVHTKAISLGNAVTAYPPGLMSIHYNPAGLSNVREGIVFSQGFSLVHHKTSHAFRPDPNFSIRGDQFKALNDPVANTESDSDGSRIYIPFYGKGDFPVLMMPLPFGVSSRQFGSRWTFAYAIYSPFVWGEETEDNGSARFEKKAAYMQHLMYAAPAASYQVSDQFSVGLSLGLGQTAMGLETDIRMPSELMAGLYEMRSGSYLYTPHMSPFDPFADMDLSMRSKSGMAPSFNVGFLWEPLSWLAIGCVYQSQIRSDLEGHFKIDYTNLFQQITQEIQNNISKTQSFFDADPYINQYYNTNQLAQKLAAINKKTEAGTVSMENFSFPERLQVGIRLSPFKKLRLMCDLHWANWLTTKSYTLKFQPEDQSVLSVLQLANIMGYALDPNHPNTLVYEKQLNPTWHISFGMEYQIKECLALRLGYENRKSNTDDQYFDLYTMPDMDFYGAGLGWKLKQGVELDLGIGYMVNSGQDIYNGTSQNLNQSIKPILPIYNPYAGQDCQTTFESYFLSMNITMPFETMYQKLDQLF
ncbi:MAG: outer membrane protein transport protein [Candidatus Magnetomorum sp.]|nr:outer membrane protein transport protein [Candidatus Magnetomorum sp.]